jgi:hypothetical protein
MATYIPTKEMAANAARGIKIRESKPASQQGGTIIGLGRARDIIARRPMSEDTVRRVKAYFDRHEIDKQGSTWNEQGKGYQAWLLWGGDAGYAWAKRIVASLNKQDDRSYNDMNDDSSYRKYLYRKYMTL